MIVLGYQKFDVGVTWAGTLDFLTNTFARVIAQKGIAIGDAIMLDGGTSSQISFRKVKYGKSEPPWDKTSFPIYNVPTLVHTYAHIP
jgi:hypothetical protein